MNRPDGARLVARCDEHYLFDVGGGQGRILDTFRRKLLPPWELADIRSRGRWVEVADDPALVEQLLAGAEDLPELRPLPPRRAM